MKWDKERLKEGTWSKFCLNSSQLYGRVFDLGRDVSRLQSTLDPSKTMYHVKGWDDAVTIAVQDDVDHCIIMLMFGEQVYRGQYINGRFRPKKKVRDKSS